MEMFKISCALFYAHFSKVQSDILGFPPEVKISYVGANDARLHSITWFHSLVGSRHLEGLQDFI